MDRAYEEIERLFRGIFTRYDKLDVVFAGFLLLVFIAEALR